MFKFITIISICILGGIEIDLFIPSFPELQRVFDLSPFEVQLTLVINSVTYCISSLLMGLLGDKYNRRSVLLVSLLIFVLGSILCVIAYDFPMILMGRALQGTGMAGPAVLAFAIISDDFPVEKQVTMLGILNGVVTIAIATAPTVGSYINLNWGWRGNFIILLVFGLIALIISFFAIPSKKGNNIPLIINAYFPLLRSGPFLYFTASLGLFSTAYYVFIGMSPILYMEDLGVPLNEFGFYQGALAGIYFIISFLTPLLSATFKEKRCFNWSLILCAFSAVLIAIMILLSINNPYIITISMMIFCASIVLPGNILFLQALEIIKGAKGRASALMSAIRLVMTAVGLSVVSCYYQGNFLTIGLFILICISLALIIIQIKLKNNWVTFNHTETSKHPNYLNFSKKES